MFCNLMLCNIMFCNITFCRNVSNDPSNIGVWLSQNRLTRSNPYFQATLKASEEAGQTAMLIGIMYDYLYDDKDPMESSSIVGGVVDA